VVFKVVFLKDNERVERANWADKESAIAYARRELPLREKKLGATAAYVVELQTREVVFVLPTEATLKSEA
jgi:hypothetical protein